MPGTVSVERSEHVGVVELHAPEPNYLDPVIVTQLADAFAELDEDADCRALVLVTGGRHFCAGANFGAGGIGDDRAAAARDLYGAALRLFDVGVPVVVAVQGAAVGAGLGLACAADFRVATPSTRFHANFTRLGFHPGFGLSALLPELVGMQHASDLLLTGRRIDGSTAAGIGLVDRLADDGDERAVARAWAAELAAAAPLAVRATKRTLRAGHREMVRAAMERELVEQTWLWETEDCRVGIEAAAQRREPTFLGR